MESYKIDVTEMSEQQKVRLQEAAFKLGYVWRHSDNSVTNLQAGYYYLEKNGTLAWDWATSRESFYYYGGRQITLQQLLARVGMEDSMTTKQFTKKDLVAGKHVFKIRKGGYYLVINTVDTNLAGVNLDGMSHFGTLDTFQEDLSYRQCSVKDDLDIVEVLVIESSTAFDYLHRNLKSIWKREEKSPAQVELEKLQNQIADLQAQANKLQETL